MHMRIECITFSSVMNLNMEFKAKKNYSVRNSWSHHAGTQLMQLECLALSGSWWTANTVAGQTLWRYYCIHNCCNSGQIPEQAERQALYSNNTQLCVVVLRSVYRLCVSGPIFACTLNIPTYFRR
jgi:hypothetical protein